MLDSFGIDLHARRHRDDISALLITAGAVTGDGKIDWKVAPIPAGRTQSACLQMVNKLKIKMKDEMAQWLAGEAPTSPTKKTTKAAAKASKPSGGAGSKRKAAKSNTEHDDDDDDDDDEEIRTKKAKILHGEKEED